MHNRRAGGFYDDLTLLASSAFEFSPPSVAADDMAPAPREDKPFQSMLTCPDFLTISRPVKRAYSRPQKAPTMMATSDAYSVNLQVPNSFHIQNKPPLAINATNVTVSLPYIARTNVRRECCWMAWRADMLANSRNADRSMCFGGVRGRTSTGSA